MSKVIIGIHGLANKPKKSVLEKWWKSAIQEGLAKTCGMPDAVFEFDMVCWADLLYLHSLHNEQGFEFDDLFNTEPYIEATEELNDYDAGLVDMVRIGGSSLLGGLADLARQRLGTDGLASAILQRHLKDLDFYYDTNREILNRAEPKTMQLARMVLQADLIEALERHRGKEIMLIAHSMGTIIAYDVLRDLGQREPDYRLAQLATIGSPLGLPYVRRMIGGERDAVRTPSVVRGAWVNYWDRRDVVAIDGHLRDDFSANRDGVRVVDDLVENAYVGLSKEPNYHKSYGYLRAPEVSRNIKAFLDT
ncbi:hypothetical protein AIOL_000065 [Candidatus Rhodobacter oscarellae]|uniref:Alpha/beta hydrolase n=1 Tax=Candidatus Rhodobacter oscarellae TaxID=1675527 RepID=A0A0J9EB98_9RHOB|nr:alpha/beta hydrolase [Candidatus Rhodobacter lobularis]KMW59916.1 hypothetical protein AIOL_000065 [Candidatus Rhodobacter lobularis]